MPTLYPSIQVLEMRRDNCLAFINTLPHITDDPKERLELEGRALRILRRTYDGLIYYRQQQERLLESSLG